ncbi:hypothetical protein Tco_1471967, partial [Tanacetum coccineum]
LLIGMELKFLLLLQVNAAGLILLGLLMLVTQTTAQVKKVNGVAEIHALIDRKQIVVSKTTIRSALQFGDEGGVECLPKSTIFEEIARIGGIADIDEDADITLVNKVGGRKDEMMFDVENLAGEEVVAQTEVAKDLNEDEQKNMDKGKGKMVELERPLKVKDQISFDEQEVRRLQAIFD